MKTYGNARSDGFPLLLTGFGVLFVAGGVGLSWAGGLVLLLGLPAALALSAAALRLSSRFELMSESAGLAQPLAAPATRFTMAGDSDGRSAAAQHAWRPATAAAAALPLPVTKPVGGVITNTPVA